MKTVIYSYNIWLKNIFPSLFPFFILSNLLINYGFVELISNIFKPIFTKLFKINSNAAFVFFLSMLTGFPSSSKYTKELYLQKKLSLDDCNKIIMFSHFSNPLFILGTIYSFINNKKLCYLIMFCQYFSNIIIGILIRNYNSNNNYENITFKNMLYNIHKKIVKNNLGIILTKTIKDAIDTLFLILGSVTIFLILNTIINKIFSLNIITKILTSGFLEITQGLKQISLLNMNEYLKALLITQFISFGGLSVHIQMIGILADTKICYKNFLLARLLHVVISSLLFMLIIKIL